MKKLILLSLMLVTTNGMAATSSDDLLRTSDTLALQEAEAVQTFYWEGLRHWQSGDSIAALNAFDYAAWHGSRAAALRLCVMDGFGVGTPANPPKARTGQQDMGSNASINPCPAAGTCTTQTGGKPPGCTHPGPKEDHGGWPGGLSQV